MTPGVILIYIIFEIDLNNRKYAIDNESEKLMPYKMSDLYQTTRSQVRKFYLTHITYVLYAFYTGAVIFTIYYMGIFESGGIMNSIGTTQDLFTFGVLTIMVFVLQHHIQVAVMMRNWTLPFTILWLVSLAQLFITYLLAVSFMTSELTYAITGQLWKSAQDSWLIR